MQPLRSVVIGPAAEPTDAAPAFPDSEASLTRMFRMSPQDPDVNGNPPSAVPTPRAESQTTQRMDQVPRRGEPDLGQTTQRLDAITQRMEPITQFFSQDDLLTRGERVGERSLGSGAFETVKPRTGSSPFATALPLPAPVSTVTPTMGVTVPPVTPRSVPPIQAAPGRVLDESSIHLPYMWSPRLKAPEGFSPPRVIMAVLLLLTMGLLLFRPQINARLAARRAAVAHAAEPHVSAVPVPVSVPVTAPTATAPAVVATGLVATTNVVATPTPRAPAGTKGTTLERAAIDAVAEGRYAAALDMYRKLAADDPSQDSYKEASRILLERLTPTR
jgi:hypothetical protein